MRAIKAISILSILVLSSAACISTPVPGLSPQTGSVSPTLADEQDAEFYSVYFTDPDNPTAGSYRGGPDSKLAEAIRNSRVSVDAAIYHLNLWSIRDALIAAHDAGVVVRVVVESDNMDEVEIQEVSRSGIQVLGDRRENFMHNKFVVIDRGEVWTGSMNFTVTGAYHNNNNLIRIRSKRLADNYTTEFEEMFTQDMFGDNGVPNTTHPSLVVDGTRIETFFSPDDPTAPAIVKYIQEAEKSISFLAYSFTSDIIAEAMLERASAGVTVTGVFEEGQYYANIGTEYDRLVEAGLDIRIDGNDRNMHHKVIIIDREIVILGSYNFSRNAEERNDENTLIIHNSDIAGLYYNEFQRVYSQASIN